MKQKNKEIQHSYGRIYLWATFNNTVVTVTDDKGTPFIFGACGMFGFKGTRKSTPYAATVTVQETLKKAVQKYGLSNVHVHVRGIGPGRESSIRAIKSSGVDVLSITDTTPIPHNGVRPPKIRRG
jgi:small subunit ribosomal protein S11